MTAQLVPALSTGTTPGGDSFGEKLKSSGLTLRREECSTLQVNVGYACNQSCKHCHLDAGPERSETMNRDTAALVVNFAAKNRFAAADLTGGAVEMCAQFPFLVENLRPHVEKLIVRTNLTAAGSRLAWFIGLFKSHNVAITASLPAPNMGQTDAQRGDGVFQRSLATLKALNAAGYGQAGTGLELNLISNPGGAFLPSAQGSAEAKFRADLKRKHGVEFNNLHLFTNVPLGRFRQWLADSGNHESYLHTLKESFNPCAVGGLMCRSILSVGWDGYLYDCDFNQAADVPLGGARAHISHIAVPPPPGATIAVGEHCFACAAGSGFT